MISYKTLKMLLGVESLEEGKIAISYKYPQVTFAFCKHLWESGNQKEAYGYCENLCRFINSSHLVYFMINYVLNFGSQLQEFVQNFLQHQGIFYGPRDEKHQDMRRRFLARYTKRYFISIFSLLNIQKSFSRVLMLRFTSSLSFRFIDAI